MMAVQWHNYLLEEILWYVMHMESKVRNNLSTPYDNIKSRGAMTTLMTDGGK